MSVTVGEMVIPYAAINFWRLHVFKTLFDRSINCTNSYKRILC